MGEHEIKIGKNTIGESTKVSMSVKTTLWIIAGIVAAFISAFTYFYTDLRNDFDNYKQTTEKANQEFYKSVQATMDKQRDRDDEFIKSIEEIRGNMRVLLDRTQSIRNDSNAVNDGVNTIDNNKPSSIPKQK